MKWFANHHILFNSHFIQPKISLKKHVGKVYSTQVDDHEKFSEIWSFEGNTEISSLNFIIEKIHYVIATTYWCVYTSVVVLFLVNPLNYRPFFFFRNSCWALGVKVIYLCTVLNKYLGFYKGGGIHSFSINKRFSIAREDFPPCCLKYCLFS